MREQQRHQPEDAFELLLHRMLQCVDDRVVAFELTLERAEHLVRPVVSGNLRRQQQFERARIDADVGPDRPQLVQGRDHAVSDGPVGLEQARDQRLLRCRTADPQQHRWQLPPHFDRHLVRSQRLRQRRDHRLAKVGQCLGGILGQLRAAERDHQRSGELLAANPVRGAHRLAGHLEVLVRNQRRQQIEQECRVVDPIR